MNRRQRKQAAINARKEAVAGRPIRENEAFRAAVDFYQAGKLTEAERVLRDVDRARPGEPEVQNLLGVIALEAGRPAEAADQLSRAIMAAPDSADLHNLLGVALRRSHQTGAAVDALSRAVSLRPDFVDARFNLGNALMDDGRFDDSIEHLQQAASMEPGFADAHFNLGVALMKSGRLKEAETAFRHTLGIHPRDGEVFDNLGQSLQRQDRLDEAEACFREALTHAPGFAKAHSHLGDVLRFSGRLEEADASLARALSLDPNNASIHNTVGVLRRAQGRTEEAVASHRQALELDPKNPLFYGSLGHVLELNHRLDEAREVIDRGLVVDAGDAAVTLIAARLDRRAGKVVEALSRLSRVSPGPDASAELTAELYFELGRLYDRTDDTDRAFENFTEGNRRSADFWWAGQADKGRASALIEAYGQSFTKEWVDSWTRPPPDVPPPVFLVGFPRSGTTLLGRVLDSHPRLQVLEEQPTLIGVKERLLTLGPDIFAGLAGLSEDGIRRLRDAYFEHAGRYSAPSDALLVDKMPLNLIEAGLIHGIFPDAKFIFALRHPCDVCLSCFMQSFEANDAMAHFFTIEDAASFYAQVMGLWRQFREGLPLSVHQVRYEALVENFETEVRRMIDFVGVEWDGRVLEYADHAAKGKMIETPSYDQVTEKIYTRAKGRWHKYRRQLAPVMDVLRPFIQEFGYED